MQAHRELSVCQCFSEQAAPLFCPAMLIQRIKSQGGATQKFTGTVTHRFELLLNCCQIEKQEEEFEVQMSR